MVGLQVDDTNIRCQIMIDGSRVKGEVRFCAKDIQKNDHMTVFKI